MRAIWHATVTAVLGFAVSAGLAAVPTASDVLGLEPIAEQSVWSAEEVEGRVLAVAVWSIDDRKSVRALARLGSIGKSMGEDVRVVSIHADGGSEEAAKLAELTAPLCPCLVDESGEVTGFTVASEPARVLLFDRAGNLRACNPDPKKTASIIRGLVRETVEEAEAAPAWAPPAEATEPDTVAAPDDRFPKPGVATPDEEVARPDAAAYRDAEWPAYNTRALSAANLQGKQIPSAAVEEGAWFKGTELLTETPDGTIGDRLMVIDFWATWCGPCIRAMPAYDRLAEKFEGRVHLVGLSGMNDSIEKVQNFIRSNGDHGMIHLYDGATRLSNQMNVRGIPHAVIVSTDGVVRWQGNPLNPKFEEIVAQAIEADPMTPAAPSATED